MNRVVASSLFAMTLLGLAGCKHVANSEIVAKYRAAGGGDPDGATAQQMGAWLSRKEHDAVRKDLTPLCETRRKSAAADWVNSDEGRICTGVAQANLFAPTDVGRKGTAF